MGCPLHSYPFYTAILQAPHFPSDKVHHRMSTLKTYGLNFKDPKASMSRASRK
jgi:hypothetical protein